MPTLHTLLGAGGAIGTLLARELATNYPATRRRLVSRTPVRVDPTDELVSADLLDARATASAVAGSAVVYLVVGVPYTTRAWEAQWPVIIENVLAACRAHGARLVFLDNTYLYAPAALGHLTETAPVAPVGRKPLVRAAVAAAVAASGLDWLIARSADFYGPHDPPSAITETILKPLRAGKAATWFGRADCRHALTFTPDIARALARLGHTPAAFGQVWHLPTVYPAPTATELVRLVAAQTGTAPQLRTLPLLGLRLLGIVSGALRELRDVSYQFDRDYDFDSRKIERIFGLAPTPLADGIGRALAASVPPEEPAPASAAS